MFKRAVIYSFSTIITALGYVGAIKDGVENIMILNDYITIPDSLIYNFFIALGIYGMSMCICYDISEYIAKKMSKDKVLRDCVCTVPLIAAITYIEEFSVARGQGGAVLLVSAINRKQVILKGISKRTGVFERVRGVVECKIDGDDLDFIFKSRDQYLKLFIDERSMFNLWPPHHKSYRKPMSWQQEATSTSWMA